MMPSLTNIVKCSFLAISENEAFARSVAVSFAARSSPTVTQLADIKCAVSEAVTNCIVHAYPPDMFDKPMVEMTLRHFDDNSVTITIKDHGVGIPDIKAAREPLYTTDTTGERSGMGFAIMESLMDNVKVSSRVNKGTTVTLKLRLGVPDC